MSTKTVAAHLTSVYAKLGVRSRTALNNARPLNPLPGPIIDRSMITHLNIRRRDRLGGLLHEYEHAA